MALGTEHIERKRFSGKGHSVTGVVHIYPIFIGCSLALQEDSQY
jgi:transcriptional regulator of NAD metabolism